ncbi:MAG: DNA polymerase IV, partial [Alphaproteobacteria bacterium]|nr:DNA polymerase IV [Alphaproteobacteria bacterium]
MTGLKQDLTANNNANATCRDCQHLFTAPAPATSTAPTPSLRCPACRSPRLLSHPEITSLVIAHLDCDAFFAAVEKRDNPDLQDKAVIIGGDKRGVVSTCCYMARKYGVHSAMPMFKAKQLCPQAVVLPPRMDAYREVGRAVRAMMTALTPLVEPLSIDEAFMDLSGTETLHHALPVQSLTALANRVEQNCGISVSIGLSHNKFLAKLASDMDKPRGFSIIGAAETKTFLADLPVGAIWGIGKAMQKKLAEGGITHIRQLQAMAMTDLAQRYGQLGLRLSRLSHGDDPRAVNPISITKSVSSETTFATDLATAADLERHLWQQAERTAERCKAKDLAGKVVVLKLKDSRFRTITRSHTLPDPTQLADV